MFKFPRWRARGQALPDVVAKYQALGAELNVLPFCSQFIPMEVINAPRHGSIIYHPSVSYSYSPSHPARDRRLGLQE